MRLWAWLTRRGRAAGALVPEPPRERVCFVQGCKNPARLKNIVALTGTRARADEPPVVTRVRLGLHVCEEHCWELDQAMRRKHLKITIDGSQWREPRPPARKAALA